MKVKRKVNEDKGAYKALFDKYKGDWVFMAEHGLGHITWSKQREIIQSVQRNQKTAVRACHSSSKTYTAAEIVVIFYNLFPESRIVTTAPTALQVEKLLWSEINKIYLDSNLVLLGRCLQTDIKDSSNPKHLAYGFSTNEPERAEGSHAWELLFIFDEAKGVEKWMWDAARGALSGGWWRWLCISTTDGVEIGSPFYNCFQSGSDWNQIHISAYESPFVTGEKFRQIRFDDQEDLGKFKYEHIDPKDVKIQLANQQYIDTSADPVNGWGKDSVLFKSKVEGMICDITSDTIVKISQTIRMFQNHDNLDFKAEGKKRGGIDCAWGGAADTVAWKAKGLKISDLPCVITSQDLPEDKMIAFICDKLEAYFDNDKGPYGYELKIDAGGGGVGFVSEMQTRGWKVIPINNAAAADRNNEYNNRISEMWFEAAKLIQDVSCPKVDRLQIELVNRKALKLDGAGRRRVESKDDYINRGFRSPDFADAFLLLFYEIVSGAAAFQSKEDVY